MKVYDSGLGSLMNLDLIIFRTSVVCWSCNCGYFWLRLFVLWRVFMHCVFSFVVFVGVLQKLYIIQVGC